MSDRSCVGVRVVGAPRVGPVRSPAGPVVVGIVLARFFVAPAAHVVLDPLVAARAPGKAEHVGPVRDGVGGVCLPFLVAAALQQVLLVAHASVDHADVFRCPYARRHSILVPVWRSLPHHPHVGGVVSGALL